MVTERAYGADPPGAAADALLARIDLIRHVADRGGTDPRPLLAEALTELAATAERLRVSEERLRARGEALALSAERLGTAQHRYSDLLDFGGAAYLLTDDAGLIHEANAHAAALFNAELGFLRRKPLEVFVSLNSRAAMRRMVDAAVHAEEIVTAPLNLQPRRLPAVPVEAHVGAARGRPGAGPMLRWLLLDASRQREAEMEVARLSVLARSHAGPADAAGLRLAETLAAIGAEPLLGRTVAEYAGSVAAAIARSAPVDQVAVGLLDQERTFIPAASDQVAAAAYRTQFGLGEGPAVDALNQQRPQRSSCLREDPRYRRAGPALAGLGARSALAVPLLVAGAAVGVLSLYRTAPFDDAEVSEAEVLGRSAAIALSASLALSEETRHVTQLRQALDSRSPIDLAKGRLMERHGLDADAAFDRLRRESQRRHVKLREVAEQVVAEPAGDLRAATVVTERAPGGPRRDRSGNPDENGRVGRPRG